MACIHEVRELCGFEPDEAKDLVLQLNPERAAIDPFEEPIECI